MVNWGAQWSCNQNVIITNSLIWIIPPLRRYSRPAASVWYSSPSRSLSEMIIDRCDMGVTSDISPRVSACKSEHINIDLCGAHLVVRVRVMDRLWLTLPGQWTRWRSRHCRRLTSCHALIIIDVCVCVWCLRQLTRLHCLSICFTAQRHDGDGFTRPPLHPLCCSVRFCARADAGVLITVWFRRDCWSTLWMCS